MRSKALCVQVCEVIEFSIEKAPLIKLKNKRKMQSKRRLLGTKSYLQSLSSKLFWLMCDSVPPTERNSLEHIMYSCVQLFLYFCKFFPKVYFAQHALSFMCVYGYQVVYCVNRRIKIGEEVALPSADPSTTPALSVKLSSLWLFTLWSPSPASE